MKTINIILDESDNAREYCGGNESEYTNESFAFGGGLIHQSEFDRVIQIIGNSVPYSKEDADKENFHNTITILGTRGSGKTSFLLSIKRAIVKREKFSKDSLFKNKPGDIQVLDIIDPTLIEEKGHVFLNVISAISELVDNKLSKLECLPHDSAGKSRRTEWRMALSTLAAGLPSIDGIGSYNGDGWQDPEFVMDNGLKAVTASRQLSGNFNKFLEISLNILGKKAFLLMFDDIDVDASKGWAVLETIRKYFTGARIITLLSGDLKLYSTLIRQKKWTNFGKEILTYEGKHLKKLSGFNNMITELESQYLQKILQPQYRIHLLTISECKRYDDKTRICIFKDKEEAALKINNTAFTDSVEISVVYAEILKFFGISNGYLSDTYSSFLMGLPLRTQIQFLSLFHLKEDGKYMISDSQLIRIADVFLSDLNEKGIDSNTIAKNPKYLNAIILGFLLKERKLEDLYQLQPVTTDDSLNACLICLSFLLSFSIQGSPYLIFDYFIKVGYIRNLIPSIGYQLSEANGTNPSIEGLCSNAVVMNDSVLRDVAGKIIAYVRGTIDNRSINSERISRAGTIPLFGEANKTKEKIDLTSDRIDRVLLDKKASLVKKTLVYLPLSSNQYIRKQSSLLTYSIYLLLGAIGELIRKVELNDINNGFSELSQLRTYIMPDFKAANNETSISGDEGQLDDIFMSIDSEDIIALFSDWSSKFPSGTKVSPHLLGKISTRLFYALSNSDGNNDNRMLGDVFHSHIVTLMNAVLIEDSRENSKDTSKLHLSNTNYSDVIFNNNLERIFKEKDDSDKTKNGEAASKDVETTDQSVSLNNEEHWEGRLKFSRWLLSCPLLIAYLRPDKKLESNLETFCGEMLDKSVFHLSVFALLNEVSVKSDGGISLGNMSMYTQILNVLTQNKFDMGRFQNEDFKSLSGDLAALKITKITQRNLAKFIAFISKRDHK